MLLLLFGDRSSVHPTTDGRERGEEWRTGESFLLAVSTWTVVSTSLEQVHEPAAFFEKLFGENPDVVMFPAGDTLSLSSSLFRGVEARRNGPRLFPSLTDLAPRYPDLVKFIFRGRPRVINVFFHLSSLSARSWIRWEENSFPTVRCDSFGINFLFFDLSFDLSAIVESFISYFHRVYVFILNPRILC